MTDMFEMMGAPNAPKVTAQQLADQGMATAADHADAVQPGWSQQAYEMLEGYALTHFEFMTEDVRVWSHQHGLPVPPDGRAWGAVTVRAVKAGLLICDHYRKTRIPPAHATPRPVWRSAIYAEAA